MTTKSSTLQRWDLIRADTIQPLISDKAFLLSQASLQDNVFTQTTLSPKLQSAFLTLQPRSKRKFWMTTSISLSKWKTIPTDCLMLQPRTVMKLCHSEKVVKRNLPKIRSKKGSIRRLQLKDQRRNLKIKQIGKTL